MKIVAVLVKGYWYHGFESVDGKLWVNFAKPVGKAGNCMQF